MIYDDILYIQQKAMSAWLPRYRKYIAEDEGIYFYPDAHTAAFGRFGRCNFTSRSY